MIAYKKNCTGIPKLGSIELKDWKTVYKDDQSENSKHDGLEYMLMILSLFRSSDLKTRISPWHLYV